MSLKLLYTSANEICIFMKADNMTSYFFHSLCLSKQTLSPEVQNDSLLDRDKLKWSFIFFLNNCWVTNPEHTLSSSSA